MPAFAGTGFCGVQFNTHPSSLLGPRLIIVENKMRLINGISMIIQKRPYIFQVTPHGELGEALEKVLPVCAG